MLPLSPKSKTSSECDEMHDYKNLATSSNIADAAIEGLKEIRDDDRVGHGGSVVLIRKFDHLGQRVQSGKAHNSSRTFAFPGRFAFRYRTADSLDTAMR